MRLHYGDPQIAIGVVFALLALLLAGVFFTIALQAGSEVAFERVHGVGYWLRKRRLALLLVIGVLVVGISLFDLPYTSGSAGGRTVVKVSGGQFFWRWCRRECRPARASASMSHQSTSITDSVSMAYLERSISSPDAQIVKGYRGGIMSAAIASFDLPSKPDDIRALVAFIKSRK